MRVDGEKALYLVKIKKVCAHDLARQAHVGGARQDSHDADEREDRAEDFGCHRRPRDSHDTPSEPEGEQGAQDDIRGDDKRLDHHHQGAAIDSQEPSVKSVRGEREGRADETNAQVLRERLREGFVLHIELDGKKSDRGREQQQQHSQRCSEPRAAQERESHAACVFCADRLCCDACRSHAQESEEPKDEMGEDAA